MSRFVVVGAGIIGASITYHLARQGASVILIDQALPARGVTGNSFGWFSCTGGDWPGGAESLRSSVLADYHRLENEVPGLHVRWSGSLVWADTSVRLSDGTKLVDGQQRVGRDEIASLEPNLQKLPEQAIYTPTDGGIDPVAATEALVQVAQVHGTKVVLDSGIATLKLADGHVKGVLVGSEFYPADTVIVAAAAGARALCEPLGVKLPMITSPAFWLKATAPVGLVKTILVTPEFEVRESREGHLLMTALHHEGASASELEQLAQRTIDHLRSSFGNSNQLSLSGYGVCQRPMPANGPIIGRITSNNSVYVAIMHSGIALAPTVGRLVAEEIISGRSVNELEGCRP